MMTVVVDDRALRMFKKDLRDLATDLAGTNRMRQPLLKIAKDVLIPSFNKNFRFKQRVKNFTIQQFIPKLAVERFVVAVLPRASWLDVQCPDIKSAQPFAD